MKTSLSLLLIVLQIHLSAQPQCGYPGDTNNDRKADYLDLLPIGLMYGQVFEPRPDWVTDWFLQCFEPWPQTLPLTFVNAGFSDTDGNGWIDSLDADAIILNYDSIHTEPSVPPAQNYQPPLDPDIPCVLLNYTFRKDADDPARFFADIFFEPPPDFPGAMAVGLRLKYNPIWVIDDSTRVLFDPANTDLMGVGACFRTTTLQRQPSSGLVEMSVSGRGTNTLQAPVQIGSISFIITEDVIIRNDTLPFTLEFDHSLIINNAENAICHTTGADTLRLIISTAAQIWKPGKSLYPNPAGNRVFLQHAGATPEHRLWIVYDLSGRELIRQESSEDFLNVEGLPPGSYFALIRSGNERIYTRFMVLR